MLNVDLVSVEYLQNLTGKKRKKDMIAWLHENGYALEVGGDGWPKVTKSFISKRLGGSSYHEPYKRKRGNREALKKEMGS
jgi:hypothetical protein